jgi:ferredoxin
MKVKFLPMDVEHEIEFNETVLHLAQRHDLHIQSVCKGLPSCAECRIQIKQGENNVPHPSSKELSLIGTAYYVDQSRLSCQLRCFGDVVVDLSEQLEKENSVAKRPQGRANRADGEKSHAVKGVLIEEYKEEAQLVTNVDPLEERPGHDKFYNEFSRDLKGLEGKPQQRQRQPHQGNQSNQGNQGNNQNGRASRNRPQGKRR